MDKIKSSYQNKKARMIRFAVLLIIAGLVLFGFDAGFLPAEYKHIFISWQMFLMAIGVLALLNKQLISGSILIIIGGIFLIPSFDIKLYWPLILVIVGIILIIKVVGFSSSGKRRDLQTDEKSNPDSRSDDNILTNNEDFIDKNVLFSSSDQILLTSNLTGGEMNVMFGEIKLDLRKTQLSSSFEVLELNSLFGSIVVYVPDDWKLNIVKSEILFGGIQDNRRVQENIDVNAPVLSLKAATIFGNIEIRN